MARPASISIVTVHGDDIYERVIGMYYDGTKELINWLTYDYVLASIKKTGTLNPVIRFDTDEILKSSKGDLTFVKAKDNYSVTPGVYDFSIIAADPVTGEQTLKQGTWEVLEDKSGLRQ